MFSCPPPIAPHVTQNLIKQRYFSRHAATAKLSDTIQYLRKPQARLDKNFALFYSKL
jgi:hypothetical protein